jgi:hypothetical protein
MSAPAREGGHANGLPIRDDAVVCRGTTASGETGNTTNAQHTASHRAPASVDDRVLVLIEREAGRLDVYAKRRSLQQARLDAQRLMYWGIQVHVLSSIGLNA